MLERIARAATWLLASSIIAANLVPPKLRPVTDVGQTLEHFGPFFAIGVVCAIGYRVPVSILCLFAVALCGGLELLQNRAPGRHARWSDFVIDTAAAGLGLLLGRVATLARQNAAIDNIRAPAVAPESHRTPH